MSVRATIRSILVHEETDQDITIRAASDKGTILSAIGLWWALWRIQWLPYRACSYEPETDTCGPYRWSWRLWRRVREIAQAKEER